MNNMNRKMKGIKKSKKQKVLSKNKKLKMKRYSIDNNLYWLLTDLKRKNLINLFDSKKSRQRLASQCRPQVFTMTNLIHELVILIKAQ